MDVLDSQAIAWYTAGPNIGPNLLVDVRFHGGGHSLDRDVLCCRARDTRRNGNGPSVGSKLTPNADTFSGEATKIGAAK